MKTTLFRSHLIRAVRWTRFFAVLAILILSTKSNAEEIVPEKERFPFYSASPLDASQIRFKDNIWKPRQETASVTGIEWMSRNFDRSGGFEAYKKNPNAYRPRLAGGGEPIKMIEAAAEIIRLHETPQLADYIHTWIDLYTQRQTEDGFLNFPALGQRKDRWENLRWSHVFYIHGHYLESAIAMHEADQSREMLDSARRSMILIDETFGPEKKHGAPGHQEIELALMRYYGMTGEKRWLDLCRFLVDQRADHRTREPFGEYAQDHIPVKKQRHIRGHAVRAGYLCAALADLVAVTNDPELRKTTFSLWDDMLERHRFVTGGVGVWLANNEGYGPPFMLPPDDSYSESCSSFANILWSARLFRLEPNAKYYDNIETILYNAFLNSISLSGDRFYYTNSIQSEVPEPRESWHSCPCCPPNITKLIANLGQYFYAIDSNGVWINLYADSEAHIPFRGKEIELEQKGNYPWNGDLSFEIRNTPEERFEIRLRLPENRKPESLKLGEKKLTIGENGTKIINGYLVIDRIWKKGDVLEMTLPMNPRIVKMPKEFKEYKGLSAVKRGPIVYCIEEIDAGKNLFSLIIPEDTKWREEYRENFLGACLVLHGEGKRWNGYRFEPVPITMIPYHLQSNRIPGEMRIWFADSKDSLPDGRVLASFNSRGPGLTALRDGEFGLKDKFAVKRFTWWPSKRKTEWLQYDYSHPRTFEQCRISWFEDTPHGECKPPKSWRLLYRDQDGKWRPIEPEGGYDTPRNGVLSSVRFQPIETTSIRLEADLHENYSSGLLEWELK